MKQFRPAFSILIFLLLLVLSCKKDPVIVDPGKKMKDVVAPQGFNFEMTKPVSISIQLPSTISYSSTNRIVQIWDENSDGQPGKLIKTGSAAFSGVFTTTVDLPVTARKVFANCFAGWRSISLTESGTGFIDRVYEADYNPGYGDSAPKQEPGNLAVHPPGVRLAGKVFKSKLENALKNGDFSLHLFEKIDTWSSPISQDSLWYATDGALSEGSIITEEGNSFARINSNQFSVGGFTQRVRATAGQVVAFSGDARGFDSQQDIYFFLIPRNQDGVDIAFFYYNLVNPGINWTNGTVAGTMPEGTVTCQILFYKRSTGKVDFDNAVVHIENGSDRDGDAVLDWEDNYPDNPNQAFDDFFPAKDKPGTLAFEESWPSQEDYDFNDMIIDYQINRISNSNNKVVEIMLIFQVRAIGGIVINGFGMQVYLAPDRIAGIKQDFEFQDNAIMLNENGTEVGQKWATFILFADPYKLLTHPGDGSPTINTTMGYHYVVPSEKRFRIFLKQPADPESVSPDKFNPFIFRENERSRETHLKGSPPTDLANTSLFGSGDDASSQAAGNYYATRNGLPWGINLPVAFEYPIEKAEILEAYLTFGKWITSGGINFKDWYIDKQGYRNWDKIYRW
jgi:LruC domain-containing protein